MIAGTDGRARRFPLKHVLMLAWVFMTLALGACNTMRGAGEDVEATGEAAQDAAQDTEDAIQDDDEGDQM